MNEHEITIQLKVLRRISIWGAAALFMFCSANELVSESITMTTYYPAPSGVYKRLTATGPGNTVLARDSGMVGIGTGSTSPVATLDVGGTGAIKFPIGDSTNRPVPPVAGSVRYNNTLSKIEIYNGTKWKTPIMIDSDFSCTGGNTETDRGGYHIHTFTASGQFNVNGSGFVDVFLVGGGGGGGGHYTGGGGGGGGIVVADRVSITAGTYNVIIGAGGVGGSGVIWDDPGGWGSDSSFYGITAGGGGGGAGHNGGKARSGRVPNGSGGGDSGYAVFGPASGNGTGHAGGAGLYLSGGGGGGAGAVGDKGFGNPGGPGGAGAVYSYSGSEVTYSGGGGGGGNSLAGGAGGAGGGGDGGTGHANGLEGTANTGGGGGGAPGWPFPGGHGGSGIVIIRYPN